jgi:UDP-N-acetyl-D-mannosaminuronate dehydrogenase
VEPGTGYDAVVLAVAHDVFARLSVEALSGFAAPDAIVLDVKGAWRGRAFPGKLAYRTL